MTNCEVQDKKLIEKTFSEKDKKEIIIKIAKSKNEISISNLAEKNAKQSLKQKLIQSDTNNNLIEDLGTKFNLNNNIELIEVYDNSHIQGSDSVGSLICFSNEGFIKKRYRKFNIKDEKVNVYPIFMRTSKFKIGYVPQYGGYFYDLTLYENLKAVAEILIPDQRLRAEKINYLISKFDLSQIRDIKAKVLSGGQKKKLVIAMALLGDPELLLLDECFAALDVMTIKMLQQIIVNLQYENKITICICDHQARDLLTCVDIAMVLSEGKVIAQGTPSELVSNQNAKTAYFGDSFKFN